MDDVQWPECLIQSVFIRNSRSAAKRATENIFSAAPCHNRAAENKLSTARCGFFRQDERIYKKSKSFPLEYHPSDKKFSVGILHFLWIVSLGVSRQSQARIILPKCEWKLFFYVFFCTIRFVQMCTTPYLSGTLLNSNNHINMGNINVIM